MNYSDTEILYMINTFAQQCCVLCMKCVDRF